MTSSESTRLYRKIGFFAVLFLTFLPLIFLPLASVYYHEINGMPAVRQGVLDLAGCDVDEMKQIPLDGEWEFYRDWWLITDGLPSPAGMLVRVPQPWVRYDLGGAPLASKGKGSYRVLVKNCPPDLDLLSYIPNISSRYRVYINGRLVSARGDMDIQTPQAKKKDTYKVRYDSVRIDAKQDVELVIELLSPHIGGLYLAPVLAEVESDHERRDFRNIFAAMFMGIIFVTILYIFFIWIWKDQTLRPIALLAMDLLVCVRILVRDEFFEVTRQILPFFRYYMVNSILQIAVFFLPIIFLYCVRQLVCLQVSKRMISCTVVFESALSLVMFWCAYIGRPDYQFLICLISYLPFVFILFQLYRGVVQGIPYTLMAVAILTLTISSILVSALNDFGFLIFNVSLFAPGCFVISMILQLVLYIRRNLQMQEQALEVENLRLKLRDNQVSLMLSQIRPHFLYNTLIAIHMLCMEAPRLAAETVMKFAVFLRTNMRFIDSEKPIDFEQEFLHIQNYVDIEKLRFQKRLRVDYEVRTTGFKVPALTIQPLVENAIRHGACKNVDGGTVLLKTYESPRHYCIEISDDGPGFDRSILEKKESSSFGLRNIIFRLKEQARAKIEFVSGSGKGQGTVVRIFLPKEEAQDESDCHG